ncbi:lamin tail domain-containing protein [Geojedonia litorea]|uniref:Lamin tail domain-containing protein n=1 Tax=Geojedonia litorea TaxID=1268269 RepID=A0ABV9N463_9FLAO
MNKKQSLIVFFFIYIPSIGYSQSIFTNPISGINPNSDNPYTIGQLVDANINVSGIGRGAGINGVNTNDRYNANSWNTGSIDLIAYFEFTLTPIAGYEIDFISFVYTGQASASGPTYFAFRSSLDGFISDIGAPIASGTTIDLSSVNYQNVTSSITFRFYGWGASASNGTFSINDFTFNGVVYCTEEVSYGNIQFPTSSPQSITVGDSFNVYAQVYEPSVTDTPNSQGAGIQCWIGYNTANNNPNIDSGWTWVLATYNDIGGNNDEYMAEIGSALIPGTYYYASRFQLNGCAYTYGGSGGIWNNNSVQLIVNDDTLDFFNLQFPEIGTITLGSIFDVFGQVYEAGLTPGLGQAPGISAWVGYSTSNTHPSTWTNWVVAGYNPLCLDCNSNQNDEYYVDIGSLLPQVGTYYYATRFKLNSGSYTYGGILSNGSSGGEWDGTTYISGILNVTPTPCSELFFSEYVEGSGNNKCLEIYNPTSSAITLTGNYTIEIYANGSSSASSTINLTGIIASGETFVICHTGANASIISISDAQSGSINFNGNDAIALVKSGVKVDVIGQIGFNPGTEWTGGSSSTLNRTLIRKSTIQYGDYNGSNAFDPNLEWTAFPIDYVSELGNHFSSCIPSVEIQLQTFSGSGITCGYTFEFGSCSLSSINDIIFTIKNLGDLPLTISDLSFINGSQYSLVSPPSTPFNISANGLFNITIRFNPNAIGLFLDTLIITSNDASESVCSINVSGLSIANCSTTIQTIVHQDFESSALDTWGYTAEHAPIAGYWDVTTSLLPDISGAQSGSFFWGITDLERSGHTGQTHKLTFEQNISAYTSVELSFYYYTINLDASDSLEYELYYDNVSQGVIDISVDTASWVQVLHNIPDAVNNLKLVIYADIDALNDKAGLDNFLLTSTSVKTTTWTSLGWSNGAPSISTVAILDYPYNTATNGNLRACNLYINDDGLGGYHTLTITDGKYVEVENNLIVNGKIIVNPKGAFIQNNALGTVTVANKSSITVEKKTAPMDAWYEYTYWSSPVYGETIDFGLSDAQASRRFWFNAKNFRDSKKKIANNTFVNNQQDDIDDDGNDWTLANGSDVMIPGVGYAATHSKSLFFGPPMSAPPFQFVYTFEGPFNNGNIIVPVYRNDDELNDNNWNLIGNPYPSAISVDLFLAENVNEIKDDVPVNPPIGSVTEGAIFLWSQDTPPSNTNSGNENENFAQSDYAIINMSSEIAGGDGVKPNRFIPSGQSFFIVYDNAAAGTQISSNPNIKEGYVVFKNTMRMADGTSNSQFFRTSESNSVKSKKLPNKLWINLTSDNGVFNQIAVGYVDKATDGYDGMAYDTPRNLSSELFSSIYTLIPNENKKLAIQGKSPQSLTLDEKIILGFDTVISIATLYTLSIDKIEGDFLAANPMYIRDNLMHINHNLSASNYTFTSEVGEFKDRFELVFQAETLSDTEYQMNVSKLTIIELDNDLVQFKTNSDKDIKSVKIMDLLGRTLYLFKGTSAVEIYNLSQLSQSAYLAEVQLSNGQIITKKAIKRK